MPPSISTRAFIQWLPNAPSEPTSTLVLTSTARTFVDIRIPLEAPHLPENTNPSHVEWAFAGRSTSHATDGKHLSQWHHWVDSTTIKPEDVVDKGEMLEEDAETGLVLEKGEMVNPATGVLTGYVEGWREGEVCVVPVPRKEVVKGFHEELRARGVRVGGGRAGVASGGELESRALETVSARLSVVLRHEDPARRSRGMVIRLGQHCQGVMRVGEEFAYERWEWSREDGWRRTALSGQLSMPCDVLTILGEEMCTDTTVTYGNEDNLTWQCEEAERF